MGSPVSPPFIPAFHPGVLRSYLHYADDRGQHQTVDRALPRLLEVRIELAPSRRPGGVFPAGLARPRGVVQVPSGSAQARKSRRQS